MNSKIEKRSARMTAFIVGVLFLVAMAASLIGGAGLIEPALADGEYLSVVSANETQVTIGVLLELINGTAVVLIAVFMFPMLREFDEALSLGYVAFRIVEAVVIVAAVVSPLTLVAVSKEYVAAGAPETSAFQTLGASLLAMRAHWSGLLLGLTFSLGALIFYYLLVKSRLVPRWISIWGFIGALLILTWNLLDLFEIEAGMIFALPIILNEIFLAVWLIVKGFNLSMTTSKPAQSDIESSVAIQH